MLKWMLIGLVTVGSLGAVLLPGEEAATAPRPEVVREPVSAIDLLGETWDIGHRPPSAEAPPESATDRALEEGPGARPDPRADLRPQPRPVGLTEIGPVRDVAQAIMRPQPRSERQPVATTRRADGLPGTVPVVTVGARAPGLPLRWVVRRQGTGDVVAELPLGAALSLLERRANWP